MSKVTAIQILKDAAALKEAKSADYQGSKWTEEDYFPYGSASYVHMLWTKMLRLRSVLERNDGNVNFESAEDTLVDMINYAAMFAAWLENQKMEGIQNDQETITSSNNQDAEQNGS